jgi:glycosyltransferase involved in cell wall biosynthesis
MPELRKLADTAPDFSVVIVTYNDWKPLHECLRSLAQQIDAPGFEVVVIDDGSSQAAPDFIHHWSQSFPMRVVRQEHAGIAAARNRGAECARGTTLVSVDSDCKLRKDCLAALATTMTTQPRHNYFQLRIVGDRSRLVGRAEELRLITVQNHLRLPDGTIKYLNTAGFAMRRRPEHAGGVFDPDALRGEDTLFLANLIRREELPWFAEAAVVQHAIPLNVLRYWWKEVRSAHLEARTYDAIAAIGVRVRVTRRERREMLRAMWRTSAQQSIGRSAWLVLLVRQILRLVILKVGQLSGSRMPAGVAEKSS